MKRGLVSAVDDTARTSKARRAAGAPVRSRSERASGRGDTRRALVWCGTELLTERGFQVTGIDEVLKRVGVPKGSFYHFFANKHEFGEAVIQNYVGYYARKMTRIFDDPSLGPLARLRLFVEDAKRGMHRYGYRRGCLIGNLGQELASLDDAFREQLEAVLLSWEKRVAGCLKEAIEAGELAAGSDAAALSRFFWIGWEGAVLRAKLTRNAEPLDQFADLFFEKIAVPAPLPTRSPTANTTTTTTRRARGR
ncbi:MAG: TetR/AcrR family transcriptional regulator [Rubrivivax sp.]|nr:TetR/AcrR family transcriptional regulator [Rubrivivax sp.]